MEESQSISRFLMLGALETLLNQALELEGNARSRLQALHGTVIRVRSERPVFSVYLLLCEDGVEVLHDYEGHVDIRIRATLGSLVHSILAPGSALPDAEKVRITGPEDRVELLSRLLLDFDLWTALRHWLENHVRLEEVLRWLRREDPAWVGRIDDLAAQVSGLGLEMGRQRLLLEEVLDEIQGFKRGLRRERQLDMLFLCSGMALLLAAFASANGQLPISVPDMKQGIQTLVLASIGLTLIMSRILFGHRYRPPRR